MAMSQQDTPAFAEATGDPHVALSPFGHSDSDFAFDPLSTNRRLPGHPDLPDLGMVVLAGLTPDTIHVMIPDCLIPPVGSDVPIDLCHVVTLQLGPVTDIGDDFSPPGLALALCRKPFAPTLILQQKEYWEEINPILAKWKNVNDSRCPECDRSIRVNMAHHLRLCHMPHMCASGGARSARAHYGLHQNLTARTISSGFTGFVRAEVALSMSASVPMAWNGMAAGHSSTSVRRPHNLSGWTWRWLAVPARNFIIHIT